MISGVHFESQKKPMIDWKALKFLFELLPKMLVIMTCFRIKIVSICSTLFSVDCTYNCKPHFAWQGSASSAEPFVCLSSYHQQ